jgi:hypothetical protein
MMKPGHQCLSAFPLSLKLRRAFSPGPPPELMMILPPIILPGHQGLSAFSAGQTWQNNDEAK